MTRFAPPPASLFQRWGAFVARRKWPVAAAGAITLAALVALTALFGGSYETKFSLPGTESQKASSLLADRFPAQGAKSATIVFRSGSAINELQTQQRITGILDQAAQLPDVLAVSSPFTQSGSISADGQTAFATVSYPDTDIKSGNQLVTLIENSSGNGLIVEAGGPVIEDTERGGLGSTELIGIVAAAIILLIAFGSIVAMGVPIVTALFGLGGAIAGLGVLASFMDMSSFTRRSRR